MLARLPRRMKSTIKPLVFVDFDDTITSGDTIATLGKTGIEANKSLLRWNMFAKSYFDNYLAEEERQKQQQPSSHSVSMTPLQKHITSMDGFRHVEKTSLDFVSNSGILGGLTRQQWQYEGANRVPLRPLAQSTLLNQVTSDRLYIVSLNWSKDWIRGALLLGGGSGSGSDDDKTADRSVPSYSNYVLDDDHLICNDLVYDPTTEKSTGLIQPSILNTSDKYQYIQYILQERHQQQHQQQEQGSLDDSVVPNSIYIGDSTGDLLPLVKCDVGIIIGDNSRLLGILQEVGITIKEGLEPLKAKATNGISANNTVYRVDDWNTIAQSGILL